MAKRILIRRDTTINWESVNPILSNGEFGVEIKANGDRSLKLGTGSTPWNSLNYFIDNPALAIDLQNHENDTSAHSATATPVANLIAMYNSNAGLKSDKVPSEVNDVLRKTELDTVNSNITGLQSDIDDLEADLSTETDNRISDISGLLYNINTLGTNLNTEIDDRISGVSYLENEIGTLTTNLNGEVNNRISDISGLQYNIDTVNEDLTSEVNNRISGVSGAIYTSSVDATNKANTAESNAKEYADDLALATQKWLPAVQTSADLPANPGDGTYLCRVITGSDYGVYQWIGSETTPEWTYFSDNLDFIDRIANPITDNIPIITANGELIDSGVSIDDIPAPANDGILTIQKNGTNIDTFSANASANKTINITLAKSDVDLSNVDNTADTDKPISTLAQTALNGKVDKTDYYIYRPDLWPFGTEINFGNGLYGQRFSWSGAAYEAWHEFWLFYMTNIFLVDCGGLVNLTRASDGNVIAYPIGKPSYGSNISSMPNFPFNVGFSIESLYSGPGQVAVVIRCAVRFNITAWSSDVWITYTK
jgi:hypothetical protein